MLRSLDKPSGTFGSPGNRKVRADAIVAIGHPCLIYTCEANVMGEIVTQKLFDHAMKTNVVRKFATLKDMADFYKIPYDQLEKTNNTFNEYMKAKKDPDFGCQFFDNSKPNVEGPF